MKKFYFLLVAMLFSIAANSTTVYFLNDNNYATVAAYCWDPEVKGWPGTVVTKTVEIDGKTYYAYDVPGAQQNIIFNNNNNGLQTKDLKVVDNAVYAGKANATSMDQIGSIVNGKFVEAGHVEINYVQIYVPVSAWDYSVCNIYSWEPVLFGGWPGAAMDKVTVSGTDYWTIKIDERELAGKDKIGGWKLNAGNGQAESAEVLNGPVFKNNYVYTLSGESYELGDTPDPIEPTETKYYLVGTMTGWKLDTDLVGTEENGVYTFTLPELEAEAQFKFITYNAAGQLDWTNSYGGGDADNEITSPINPDEKILPIENNKTYNAYKGGVNYYIQEALTNVTIKLDLSSEPATMSISGQSGVEVVEAEAAAAEYFNLQGVRVAQPANGLYIVRRGNTVTKELVK